MARKPNQRKEYTAHYNRVERYASLLDGIYKQATDELSKLALSINHDPAKPFKWIDYPQTKKRVDTLLKGVASNIEGIIVNGATTEWDESNFKNDRLARSIIGFKKFDKDDKGRDIIPERFKPYFNNNADALQSFIGRKQKGLNLSQKVWKLSEQYKDDSELALSVGLSDGRSAAELSRDIRQYLQEPKKLFRRVMRDDKLRLSKAAKAYHPGQGVYRSSYKNAMRLTRTEINIAYRTADSVRWGQMDFIVGFEVKRSGRGYDCSVCSSFAGKYPKNFKFVGWHPHCRCYVIPILKTDEEFWAWDGRGNAPTDSVNKVTDVPQGYKDWVGSNRERIAQAKENGTLPYFLRDNREYLDAKAEQPVISTIAQRALERHTAGTPEQISDVQSRWDKRQIERYCDNNRMESFDIVDEASFDARYKSLSDPTLKEWLSASDEVKKILYDYTNDAYLDVNPMCNNPDLPNILQRKFIPSAAKQMKHMESFISKTTLQDDMLFKRTTKFDEIENVFGKDVVSKIKLEKDGVVGSKGLNKRFSSVSFTEKAEFGNIYDNDVEIIYFAPKGTQATYARGFSNIGGEATWKGEKWNFKVDSENEFILNRNYNMRISGAKKLTDGRFQIFIDILTRKK